MLKKRVLGWDMEIYPNFASATFIDLQSKEERVFIFNHNHYPLTELRDFIISEVSSLVGYNSQSYDDTILEYMIRYRGSKSDLNIELYALSQEIINNDAPTDRVKDLRWNKSFKGIDLIRVMFSSKLRKGLKQVAINLKHPRIQDLPIPFDKPIEDDQIPLILDYNRNDVIITCKLFYKVLPDLKLREEIEKVYGVEVISESDTGIAKKILNKQYEENSGVRYKDFKDLRTYHSSIDLKDIIDPRIKFEDQGLISLLDRLKGQSISRTTEFSESVRIGGFSHTMAKGGLHIDSPPMMYTNDKYTLWDVDADSFYPSIILQLELFPAHLDKRAFLATLSQMTRDRLEAKRTGDMVKANAMKVSINSLFGLLGMEFYWLFDEKLLYTVTINGQLFLLELIDQLHSVGIEVIYSNTDGVTSKVYKGQEDLFREVCDKWRTKYGFGTSEEKFEKMILKDVNNFLFVTEKGKLKKKGSFVTEISLKTGFEYPVVPLAVEQYLINHIPVEHTVTNHTDIYDYCISQKSDDKFKNEFHQIVNGEYKVSDVQKTLRYFVSTDGGSLFKVPKSLEIEREKSRQSTFQLELVPKDLKPKKKVTERIAYEQGSKVTLFNDYFEGDYKVNYQYYINEAKKMIDVIEKDTKLSLFL